ncbi:MAG: zinc ribbon domain-containing protein [Olsenella sp.]|nr:zinc ribbon domain-containing protein [Olsenella sp.]
MKCISCGRELAEGVNFCRFCGARQVAPEPEPVPAAPESVPSPVPHEAASIPPDATTAAKPRRLSPVAIVLGVIVTLALAGAATYHVTSTKRAEAYAQALEYYAGGAYQQAADAFTELGDYEDAASMAESARLWLAAQAEEAKAGEDPAAWDAAAQAYERINEEAAKSAAENCRSNAVYYTAVGLMELGSWNEAGEALAPLASSSFKDAADLQLECDAHVTCDQAEALLSEGSYYDAYKLFSSLVGRSYEGLPDFDERAAACVQDFPSSGTVYSNPDYPSTAVPLTIKNDDSNTFYKIYDGDTLVRSVFISPNDSTTVNLPAGTYRMNEAHGDEWFGTDDMFGDDGSYFRCDFGGSETFELESGYSYEISPDVDGTSINNSSTDRESF